MPQNLLVGIVRKGAVAGSCQQLGVDTLGAQGRPVGDPVHICV